MKRGLLISILDFLAKNRSNDGRFMAMKFIVDLLCFSNGLNPFFYRFNRQTLSFIEKKSTILSQAIKSSKRIFITFFTNITVRSFARGFPFPLAWRLVGNAQIFKYYNLLISFSQAPYIQSITYLMEKVIQILKEHEALEHSSLEEKDIVIIEKRPGFTDPVERRKKFVQGIISQQVPEEKFAAIMHKIDENEIPADISQALPANSPFGDYGQIDNVFDEGKTHLKHKEGEVLLVDVWATWCGPCQRPMQHNQEMLQKNEAGWSGKARIVAVSVDEQKKTVVTRVNTKGWSKIEHLTLLGWKNEHKLIKDFAISGIPFVCLVDKWGKINFTGHPSSINLEERINQLIAQEHSQAAPGGEKEKEAQAGPQANLSAILNKDYIKQQFSNNDLLCIKGECTTTLSNCKTTQKSVLQVFAFEDDKEAIEKARKLYEGVGTQVKVHEVKAVKVPHPENPTCWQCNTPLQFPYYWLYWQQNGPRFGCVACIEKKSEQLNHHFFYEKNAVLLFGKWERISIKNLGHNHQPTDYTTAQGHGFGCNGCGGNSGLGQARYICLGCRAQPNFRGDYVDLCEGCRAKIQTQEIKQQLKYDNHHDSHPLLRVLYGVKGYYEY